MFACAPLCGCTFTCSAPNNRFARSIASCSAVSTFSQPPYQRSEEHTSELQSQSNLVCRLLLEKKKITQYRLLSRPIRPTLKLGIPPPPLLHPTTMLPT